MRLELDTKSLFDKMLEGSISKQEIRETETYCYEMASYMPDFFENLTSLKNRKLTVSEEQKGASLPLFHKILESLQCHLLDKFPAYALTTLVKVYEETPHGSEGKFNYLVIRPGEPRSMYNELLQESLEYENINNRKSSASFSNVLWLHPNFNVEENLIPKDPSEEFSGKIFFPSIDFDIPNTGKFFNSKELQNAVNILKNNGFSGYIIQSGGELNKGGYHYLADFFMPYDSNYYKVMANFLKILTPSNITTKEAKKIRSFGNKIFNSKSAKEMKEISNIFLSNFRRQSWPDSFIDSRWVAHRIYEGCGLLRGIPGKDYIFAPQVCLSIKELEL